MSAPESPVVTNPWASLRRYTAARIALGRSGVSQPTAAQLAFQLDHAQARDAVHRVFETAPFASAIHAIGAINAAGPVDTPCSGNARRDVTVTGSIDSGARSSVAASISADDADSEFIEADATSSASPLPAQPGQVLRCLTLASAAPTREVYLQRPDLGRRLAGDSAKRLRESAAEKSGNTIALVFADGLSARAIEQQGLAFLKALLPLLLEDGWTCLPISVVTQGRVAIGDEIGALLGASVVAVMIGERPGLSSPDSMGVYMTWAPKAGLTDERRNCISNIRPEGLAPQAAARQLQRLMAQARLQHVSGVALKVASPPALDTATMADTDTGADTGAGAARAGLIQD